MNCYNLLFQCQKNPVDFVYFYYEFKTAIVMLKFFFYIKLN